MMFALAITNLALFEMALSLIAIVQQYNHCLGLRYF
jgi:hypothetical protein